MCYHTLNLKQVFLETDINPIKGYPLKQKLSFDLLTCVNGLFSKAPCAGHIDNGTCFFARR